jgi:catechol 2,3-dioxygenase-like lactoylglutathione lyase family enzyme
MKRFHVHVAVVDLDESIAFYSKVFGAGPTVRKSDYAKWMVEDPRLNFAISARGGRPGVNHLGFQLDSDAELRAMHGRLTEADAGLVEEIGASCCYAKSDKYWVTDPSGVAWETYHTLGSIPVFGADDPEVSGASAATGAAPTRGCCAAGPVAVGATIPVKAGTGCRS